MQHPYPTRELRGAALPMNAASPASRTQARRQHGSAADPRLQGLAFALIDRQGLVVHLADDLAAVRAWLQQRRGDR